MVKPDGCPAYTNISGAIGPALEPKATSLRRQAQSVEKNEPPQVGGKMPGTQEIRTPRPLLRRHMAADARALCEGFGRDPAMFAYTGWNPYATPQMAEVAVREYIEAYADPRFYGWAIESAGRLVGTIGAYDYDAQKTPSRWV
jgi:RimJ/RimL family protein N-acetyltransferase